MDIMFFIALIAGYLAGSVPFGLVLAKIAGHGDIRDIGSGNIGATNVLRTGDKKLAAAVLFLDGVKGAILCLAFLYFDLHTAALLAGLGAILGHMFPVWLKFKGGKGVATGLAILLALAPFAGLAACATWLAVFFLFRYSSLSALAAMLAAPFYTYMIYDDSRLNALCGFMALLIWFKHRANIQRLVEKKEPKS